MRIASASVADLYTVPASTWAQIQQRVSMTLLAQPLQDQIQAMLPHFPDLVAVCQQWQAHTFPELIGQSQRLAAYADEARQQFGPLAQELTHLDPAAPLPPATRAAAQQALQDLRQRTTELSQAHEQLKAEINKFTLTNQQVDAEGVRYASQLGFLGEPMAQQLQAVDAAVGQVLGHWSALSDDLRALTADPLSLTVAVLLSLDLQTALLAWQSIGEAVAGFRRNIAGLPAAAAA